MKRFFLYTILSFFLLLPSAGQAPANSNDSIRLSLLTCAPGEEIYSLFGHTAIRYENPSQGIDVVFNYGLFSFNTPNFIFRFSLGETDYQLGVTDYEHFAAEYAFYGRSVWQQTLNLTDEEKTKLIQLLQENYRPENRVYRYNFFYDRTAGWFAHFPRHRTSILQRTSVGAFRHRPLHRKRSRPAHHTTANDVCPLLSDGCFRRRTDFHRYLFPSACQDQRTDNRRHSRTG